MPTSVGYMTVAGREFLLSVVEVMTFTDHIADIALVNGLNESRILMVLLRRSGRKKNWDARFP